MQKRVAIIGAGVSGLASLRACLQEGLEVTCYELTNGVGGLWRYRDEIEDDTASIFWALFSNTSKEMSAFSEYPPSPDCPVFPHHIYWYQYICDYAVTFGLLHHIKFYHKVTRVTRAEDLPPGDPRIQGRALVSGQWIVEVFDFQTEKQSVHLYDAVMVCSGRLTYEKIPPFLGLDQFQGRVLHSGKFRKPEEFSGGKVLVVGFGNSALDIAIECSHHADKVYISTRRGGWVNPRTTKYGYPRDAYFLKRLSIMLQNWIPSSHRATTLENELSERFDHELYGIKPHNRALNQYPITNDLFHVHLMNGTIKMKSNISRFTNDGVIFDGEDETLEIDTVIFATGYDLNFPFLTGIEQLEDKLDKLYKMVFPAWLDQPTLAFIGLILGATPVLPLSEIQARWVAKVFKQQLVLPSKQSMIKDAQKDQDFIDRSFYKGFTNRAYVFGPVYNDQIASFIGAKPKLTKLFFTDWKLFWSCLAGPMLPYHYRLNGPHPWKGARQAILSAERRMGQHYQKVSTYDDKGSDKWKWSVTIVAMLGLGIAVCSRWNVLKL